MLYRHKDLTKAATIILQPHSSAFLKMSNHQAVMETELRHYSAITRGKMNSLFLSDVLCPLFHKTVVFFVCVRAAAGPRVALVGCFVSIPVCFSPCLEIHCFEMVVVVSQRDA